MPAMERWCHEQPPDHRLDAARQLFIEYHSFADTEQSLHVLLQRLAESGFRYYLQTQFCPRRPLVENDRHLGMDLQINVFAKRAGLLPQAPATHHARAGEDVQS